MFQGHEGRRLGQDRTGIRTEIASDHLATTPLPCHDQQNTILELLTCSHTPQLIRIPLLAMKSSNLFHLLVDICCITVVFKR